MMPQDTTSSLNVDVTVDEVLPPELFDDTIVLNAYMPLDNGEGTMVRIDTIDGTVSEFMTVFKSNDPYIMIPMLGGDCYQWSDEFINDCIVAMSTDRMTQFNEIELQAWYNFVNYQNYHSTSALTTNANNTAVGCTIPNAANQSFVVARDGTIFDGTNNQRAELCQPPTYEVMAEDVWFSLDQAFMSLYNCEEINDCNASDIVGDSTCPII